MKKIIVNGVSNKKFITEYAPDFDLLINKKIAPNSIPDRLYRKGKACWVIQTLINLKYYYGDYLDITLTNQVRAGAVNLLHYDDFSFRTKPWLGCTIVCQADRPPVYGADYVVVQNPLQTESGKIFLPHWPQPNLKSRSKDSNEIKTIGFFGHVDALPDFFTDKNLISELSKRGITLRISTNDWTNYSGVDIAISFRKEYNLDLMRKPASKLINAWSAGCPLICDNEPSMRAIRISELDYLIAKTPEQFIEAVDQLRNQPDLYTSMVSNGKKRFEQYDRESTVKKWFSLIEKIHNTNNTQRVKTFSRFITFVLYKTGFY
ncbi:glycosyltransferase [Photorhabdus asymbiotica]|uniref:glycosyltransferase n=1 Tax=Photorhabdus asymbiotica TaxID=291112 RepID=UPI003DA7A34E